MTIKTLTLLTTLLTIAVHALPATTTIYAPANPPFTAPGPVVTNPTPTTIRTAQGPIITSAGTSVADVTAMDPSQIMSVYSSLTSSMVDSMSSAMSSAMDCMTMDLWYASYYMALNAGATTTGGGAGPTATVTVVA